MPWNKMLLAIFATMIFGLNAVLSKVGLESFPPFLFNFIRFSLVLPFLLYIPRPAISWKMLIAIALVMSVAHLTFGTVGLHLGASAGTFVFIQQTGSIFAIAFAYLLFKQRPTAFDIAGIVLGLIGIYWICASKGTQGSAWAIAALIGSAITWGLGFTLVKKAQAPSVPTTVWTAVIALPCIGIASGLLDGVESTLNYVSQAPLSSWLSIIFAAWASMLGAGSIFMYLMRTEQVSKVAPFNMLVPVFGCFFSVLILGEQLNESLLIGGLWIFAGLLVTQFGSLAFTRTLRTKGTSRT